MDVRGKLVELLGADVCKHDCCQDCEYGDNQDACIAFLKERIADHLIAHGVTAQEWISVEERLPELGERVLIFDQGNANRYTSVCFLEKDEHDDFWWCECGGDYLAPGEVTHWMPIPEPPKDMRGGSDNA